MDAKAVGQRIKAAREKKNMTQEDLAQATHLTQSVIAGMEGKRTIPQLDALLKVVIALGCKLEIKPIE